MKILFLQQIAILKAKHSRRPQSFWGNMTKLPSNDEITLFDGTFLNAGMPDRPASSQSSTGMKKTNGARIGPVPD